MYDIKLTTVVVDQYYYIEKYTIKNYKDKFTTKNHKEKYTTKNYKEKYLPKKNLPPKFDQRMDGSIETTKMYHAINNKLLLLSLLSLLLLVLILLSLLSLLSLILKDQ